MGELARQSKQTIEQLLGTRFNTKIRANSTHGKEYHMPCPFCGGNDRFAVFVDSNTWSCRQCVGADMSPQDVITFVQRDQNKSFLEACEILGINLDDGTGRKLVDSSKRGYENLAAYAAHKRVPVTVFTDAKWRDGEWQNRRALIYPTYKKVNGHVETVERVRFIDGDKPTYKPCETGAPAVWYGLKKAIDMASKIDSPIVLCNGEASTLVGQYYGVPAFCKTAGENDIPADLLTELTAAWNGKVLIALDCDKQGRDVAEKVSKQIADSQVIDLGFSEHGDLADFCKLYEQTSLQYLLHLVPIKQPETVQDAISYVNDIAQGATVDSGRTLTMPYKLLHPLGGLCRFLPPGKLTLIFGMSGHGKTSFAEPMMEYWQQRGINGIFDGREFDPMEYEFRRIQRHSGQVYGGFADGSEQYYEPITYTEFMAHKKAQEEQRDNVSKFLRDGQFLTPQKQRTAAWVQEFVSRWTGIMRYAPKKSFLDDEHGVSPAVNAKQAQDDKRYGTLSWARLYIHEQRDRGIPVDYMIFDYMQLFNLHSNNAPTNAYQTALYMIKDFAVQMKIHCIVLSQVNKSADSDARGLNKPLPVAAMQFINDAPANLTISLNMRYIESNETDWQGQPQMVKQQLPNGNFAGMVWVIKNSMERTGQIKMQADLAHYRWMDITYTIETADLLDDEDDKKPIPF